MTVKWPTSEVQVAAPVVAWLRAGGWDVYQEVRAGKNTTKACDIIATRDRLVWAIECKTRLSEAVILQAYWWSRFAHYASVAVPPYAHSIITSYWLRGHGMGVLVVKDPTDHATVYTAPEHQVDHELQPQLNRTALANLLRGWLHEEQKTYHAAGSPCGGGWSPYKATVSALVEQVVKHPGLKLKEAITGRAPTLDDPVGIVGIAHHYGTDATAVSSLRHWLDVGKVPGVRVQYDGPVARLYLEGNT
jgi:hypothetical protein